MANQYSLNIIQDGPRNAQVKIDGVLDSSDAVLVPAVGLDSFINNGPRLILAGFRVDEINYSISENLNVHLYWQATAPQSIAQLTGHDKMCFEGGIHPVRSEAGYSGNILLSTTGFASGTPPRVFTLVLKLIKLYTV